MARGQTQDIQRLAELSGVAAEALGANAPRGLDRRHFDLRGEHVSAEIFASPFTVFCPACLVADDLASGGKSEPPTCSCIVEPDRFEELGPEEFVQLGRVHDRFEIDVLFVDFDALPGTLDFQVPSGRTQLLDCSFPCARSHEKGH